ncbi:MAG: hypothetical protein ACRCXM_13630, partial [Beijerinckiaceae bacterium]
MTGIVLSGVAAILELIYRASRQRRFAPESPGTPGTACASRNLPVVLAARAAVKGRVHQLSGPAHGG